MSLTPDDAGELLRAHGMRSTPQRRAILSSFHGGQTEHLSADEVYARASRSLPDLSRATVYTTLAEFSEHGLLSAFGSPDPVRYETNADPHAHLRCDLCQRVFDLTGGRQDPAGITDPGFVVKLVETRAEGICDQCTAYAAGLTAGAVSRTGCGENLCSASIHGVWWLYRSGFSAFLPPRAQRLQRNEKGRLCPGQNPPDAGRRLTALKLRLELIAGLR